MSWFKNLFTPRWKKIEKFAGEFPMDFQRNVDRGLFEQLDDFTHFRKGFGPEISNVLSLIDRETQTHVKIFDFQYKTQSTDSNGNTSTHYHNNTVGLIITTKKFIPYFELNPKSFFRGLGTFFGKEYFEHPDDPEFSESFTVRTEEAAATSAFLNEGCRELLKGYEKYSLCGHSHFLVLYNTDESLKADYETYKVFFDRLYNIKYALDI